VPGILLSTFTCMKNYTNDVSALLKKGRQA